MNFNDGATPQGDTAQSGTEGLDTSGLDPNTPGLTAEERLLIEQYQQNADFRQAATQVWHQMRAGVPQQQQASQQPRQETPLEQKRRRFDEVQARKQAIERISYVDRRDVTDEEGREWQRLDAEESTLDRELIRLEREETARTRQQVQQQAQFQQFQQQVGQRFAHFAQPRIQNFNVSAADKQRLYAKFWELFTQHPFYGQIADIQAADRLIQDVFNDLVANHGAPKQRAAAGGARFDERYNDTENPQAAASDPYADRPEEVREQLRRLYPSRFEGTN